MKKIVIVLLMVCLKSLNAYANNSCGTYWVAGNPVCSPSDGCKKSGVYLYKNTSNQVFIEIENYSLPEGISGLSADYMFKVFVNRKFGVIPKKVKFISGPDSIKSLNQLKKGFGIIKKQRCKA